MTTEVAEIERLQTELGAAQQKVSELEAELEEARGFVTEHETQLGSLEDERVEHTAQIEELSAKVELLTSENASLTAEVQQYISARETHEASIAELSTAVADGAILAAGELETLQQALTQAQGEVAAAQEAVNVNQATLEAIQIERDDLKNLLATRDQIIAQRDATIESLGRPAADDAVAAAAPAATYQQVGWYVEATRQVIVAGENPVQQAADAEALGAKALFISSPQ